MSTRRFTVNRSEAGTNIVDWLRRQLHLSRSAVLKLLQDRKVRLAGAPCSNPQWRLRAGQRVEVQVAAVPARSRRRLSSSPTERSFSGPKPVIRYLDEHLVVVDKPAGLTTMRHADEAAEFGVRGRRFLPATLQDMLPALIAAQTGWTEQVPRAVHRIDKETSGLVVFARTEMAERHLGQQFRAHSVERLYLAVVRGRARSSRIESWLVRDRGDGRRGSTSDGGPSGQHAVTHVRVVEELGDFTLVECRLETGRTHQVRIHLGEAGTPLCGERVYDRPRNGRPVADNSGPGRVALHAATLGLEHPATGQRLRWTSPLPADLEELLRRLRRN